MAYALQAQRVALQFMQQTLALVDNMRANASAWLTFLSGALDGSQGNPTLAQIAAMMNGAAAAWITSITNAQTWGTNNSALAASAATWLASTVPAINTDLNALKTAATNLQNADKTTVANAQAACNAVLAAVPAAPSIF